MIGFAGAAWSLVKGACSFIKKNKKAFLVSLVLIFCALFIDSWLMRGAKIDRLKEENKTVQLKLDNAKEKYKADLEDCGEKIVEIEDKAEEAKRKSEATIEELNADLAAVTEEADRAWRESTQTRTEVAMQIDRAETAEEKIEVFLDAVNKRLKR